jgi:hypothetical protein
MNFKPIACEKDCRFNVGGTTTTAMGWQPTYDKDGRLLNKNPNISQTDISCESCGKRWIARTQYGETEYKVIE